MVITHKSSAGEYAVSYRLISYQAPDVCTAPPHVPTPAKNRTAVVVCRRMLQAVADKRILVEWVKVKGHSHEEGNVMADKLVGYAQRGGAMNEQDIDRIMSGLAVEDD